MYQLKTGIQDMRRGFLLKLKAAGMPVQTFYLIGKNNTMQLRLLR